jgi:hypothetical protein
MKRILYLTGKVNLASPEGTVEPPQAKKDKKDEEEKVEAEEDEEEDEEDEEEEKVEAKSRPFSMLAYTGGVAKTGQGAFVFDLAGMSRPKGRFPALLQHDPSKIAGWAQESKCEGALQLAGQVTNTTRAGREVIGLGAMQFPWQASVGLEVDDDDIEAADDLEVNGRRFDGPVQCVRASVLREVSFVPFGADDQTEAVVARRTTMADEKQDPGPDPVLAERERVKAIRAAFAEDPGYALEQIEKGSSLLEAQAGYAEVLKKKLVEATAARSAECRASGFVPAETTTGTKLAEDPVAFWRGTWRTFYETSIRAGRDDYEARREATTQMHNLHPAETERFVAAWNARPRKEA